MPSPPQIPEPHLHLVYAAALRQTRDTHVAADITQAVFVLLARRIQQGRPPKETHMAGWLLTVTRFAVKESRRAATRRAYHEKQAASHRSEPSPTADPEASLLQTLDDALLALPAADRELLTRRYLQSTPVADLAATLRIPPNTATKRIARALERLRLLLQNRGITTPAALLTATLATQSLIRTPPAVAAQILAAPTTVTPLAKSIAAKLFLLKLQTALAVAALLVISFTVAFLLQQHRRTIAAPVTNAPPIQSPPSATARGLLAGTPDQLRIRSLLYQLRYSVITTATTEETYAAIRDLVSIGKPAIPELCAELDRATSDSELRALTFTLRAINDPRAVPALIRALPKTPVLVSDFGQRIDDPALWQFVTDHHLPGTTPETFPAIDIPRANREITAALEKFANATIARASLGGARNNQPGNIARAQALRQQDADRWQQWWDAHYQGFLPEKEPFHTTSPTSPDLIESAGIAAFGPLFPTGPEVRLGPIHDLILPPQGLYDVPAFFNLQSGRAFTIWENATDKDKSADSLFPWLKSAGIDVSGSASWRRPRQIGNTNGITTDYPADVVYSLHPFGTRTWPVDNARWDSFESDVHNPAPLDRGKWEPSGNLIPRDLETGELTPLQLPATFLFITSDHSRGILQLLDSSDNPRGIHFRYRLIEATPTTKPATQSPMSGTAAAHASNLAFAPERTITLHSPSSVGPAALRLDTAEPRPADPAALNLNEPSSLFARVDEWLATWHGDLIVQPLSPNDKDLFALRCSDMAAFPCTTAAFQNLSPAKAAAIAASPPRSSPTFITRDSDQQSPATWAFKTRTGATGLLQITSSTATTLTLRYKLIEQK